MVQPSARPPASRSSLGRATRLDIGALVDVERVLTSLAHIVEHEADRGIVAVVVVRPDVSGRLFADESADFITWADPFHRRLTDIQPSLRLAFRSADDVIGFVPGLGSRADVAPLVEGLAEALDGPVQLADGPVTVDSRAGVALVDEVNPSVDAAVEAAELALDRTGPGRRACLFSPFQRVRRRRAHDLEARIRSELAEGAVMVRYQPMVDLRTGAVGGVEALARMRDGRRGELAPGVFLPVATRFGLMADVGAAVLANVGRDLERWRSAEVCDLNVWINLSVRDVLDDETFTAVAALAAPDRHVPGGGGMSDHGRVPVSEMRTAADRLSAVGLAAAADYHTVPLTELARCDLHTVKLNRRVVRHLAARSIGAVDSLVAMLHELGMVVTADGIETEGHLRPVVAAGCDLGQGFFFARPVEPSLVDALIGDGADRQRRTPAATSALTSSGS